MHAYMHTHKSPFQFTWECKISTLAVLVVVDVQSESRWKSGKTALNNRLSLVSWNNLLC